MNPHNPAELDPFMRPPEAQGNNERIHDKEIAHLGALVMDTAMREGLSDVAADHVDRTGVINPNELVKDGIFIAGGEIPMTSDNVYRTVQEVAIEDLADVGVVRGAYTATDGKRANSSPHKAFWNRGKDGRNHNTGQGFVIEAPAADAEKGWVTADKVKGVYTRDSDGQVKNIISEPK